ncbi:hypothetical protein WIA58_13030 [Serratia marcescens]|uniref:hypothetical protein n=1 Tax=Serratia marcescens TaxID=615 RepID=UPI00339C46CA
MMKKNLSTSLKKLTFSVGILLLAAPGAPSSTKPQRRRCGFFYFQYPAEAAL